jgi:phenylacetate-CoA ligase
MIHAVQGLMAATGTFACAAHLWRAHNWKAERIGASQLSLLRRQIAGAAARVPHYRESFGEMGIDPVDLDSVDALRRLPFVTKETVKACFPDRLVADGVPWKSLYSMATSGTHDRIMLFHDENRRTWDRGADVMLELTGNRYRPGQRSVSMPPDACAEYCGSEHGRDASTAIASLRNLLRAPAAERPELKRRLRRRLVRDHVWRERILPSFGQAGTAPAHKLLDEYLQSIQEWRPATLKGLPMFLYVLARHAVAGNWTFSGIRVIRPHGGKFSHVMARTVERAFGAPVRENYGTGELGTIAFDCAHNRHQHLLGELFLIEFLRDNQPVGPGELGELVITDLRNRASPLIRYRIGDVGRYFTGPCACGFEGLLFSVDGRLEETVVTRAGRAVTGAEIIDCLLAREEIAFTKVIQTGETEFLVDIVPAPTAAVPDETELARMLGDLLQEQVRVRRRVARYIAPEASGKYRLVVSSTYQRLYDPKDTAEQLTTNLHE